MSIPFNRKQLKIKGTFTEPEERDGNRCQRSAGEGQSRSAGDRPSYFYGRLVVGFSAMAHGGNVDASFFVEN